MSVATMTFDGSGIVRCSCGGECVYCGRGKWQCPQCDTRFNEAEDNVIVRPPTDAITIEPVRIHCRACDSRNVQTLMAHHVCLDCKHSWPETHT